MYDSTSILTLRTLGIFFSFVLPVPRKSSVTSRLWILSLPFSFVLTRPSGCLTLRLYCFRTGLVSSRGLVSDGESPQSVTCFNRSGITRVTRVGNRLSTDPLVQEPSVRFRARRNLLLGSLCFYYFNWLPTLFLFTRSIDLKLMNCERIPCSGMDL